MTYLRIEYRVLKFPSFAQFGTDYASPFKVHLTKFRERGILKSHVVLFVCLVTLGVHLELVEKYSAESFIVDFHRFTSRIGHCSDFYSDQGTYFVGADTDLRRLLNEYLVESSEVHRVDH